MSLNLNWGADQPPVLSEEITLAPSCCSGCSDHSLDLNEAGAPLLFDAGIAKINREKKGASDKVKSNKTAIEDNDLQHKAEPRTSATRLAQICRRKVVAAPEHQHTQLVFLQQWRLN